MRASQTPAGQTTHEDQVSTTPWSPGPNSSATVKGGTYVVTDHKMDGDDKPPWTWDRFLLCGEQPQGPREGARSFWAGGREGRNKDAHAPR